MKKLFGLFVISILSSTVMAELVCKRINGCEVFPNALTERGYCPTCVDTSPVVKPVVKSKKISISPSSCPNYFERNHGGKSCEISRSRCDPKIYPTLCDKSYKNCKEIEKHYNENWERNHGKLSCG